MHFCLNLFEHSFEHGAAPETETLRLTKDYAECIVRLHDIRHQYTVFCKLRAVQHYDRRGDGPGITTVAKNSDNAMMADKWVLKTELLS